MEQQEQKTEAAGTKPAAAASAGPAAPSGGGEVFSPALLRFYYSRVFPYDHMFKWLSYGHDPSAEDQRFVDKGFFMRREFSFTIEDDIYIRYISCMDKADMMAQIRQRQPHKIDIGAIYTHPPKDHNTVKASAFAPVERELVFDVDMTDYDDVRTCCDGARICHKCWSLMTVALKVVNRALTEDFGFRNIFWVYSGRRGIHCWVCDPRARHLTDAQRGAVVEYLSVVTGNEHQRRKAPLTTPLHPALDKAYPLLLEQFETNSITEDGQRFLCSPDLWKKVVDMLPESPDLRAEVSEGFADSKCKCAADRWQLLQKIVARHRKSAPPRLAQELATCIQEIVFTFTYPRLDVNVSKARNHLLKSPFCAHPKTGRVCVPILVRDAERFDPMTVPTLADLSHEINDHDARHPEKKDIPDIMKTSLWPYMEAFDRHFLQPLYAVVRKEFRDLAARDAAARGDF